MMLGKIFKRAQLSDRQESAVQKTLQNLRAQRRKRFRILVCVDGSEGADQCVRQAARLARNSECDLIILHVRPIDQGLHSEGLQVRLARQNMLDAGFELPGVRYLKQALRILQEEGVDPTAWHKQTGTRDAWGDAAGDTKVEYKSPQGQTVVLKLKTAPDVANGILDQYELGPYNLIICGEPSRWRSEFKAFFDAGIVQQVTTLAPCSVLVVRAPVNRSGFMICTDGSSRSMQAVRRAAVLAIFMAEPITLFSVASNEAGRATAEEAVANAKSLLTAMRISVHDTRVAIGRAATEIVRQGGDYKMIVVTDEGRSRLQRLLRGSTATEVVRRAKTSVLDVR